MCVGPSCLGMTDNFNQNCLEADFEHKFRSISHSHRRPDYVYASLFAAVRLNHFGRY